MIALLLGLQAYGQTIPTPAAESYTPQAVELIPGVEPAAAPPQAHEIDPRARALGRKLRCPVCQGSNITDSPSPTAKAMFERTRQLMAAGYTDEQIVQYFVDKYTEFVLLDPQSDGSNAMLYLAPGLGVGLGLAFAIWAVVGWRKEPGESIVAQPAAPDTLDDYERRLLAELNADE
ncbi:MAG: cytochrome c-type biogenesis protein CcmH [Myxococcales bacterium]|nr:cytochrome c-type biogenesis protein CcmH [Myxococcales bacterium]MCB9669191.1 cytochrome c-type biogenesis protein CcmH [Alphaproteobacteria bacterium]MCB9692918.1 cytochrome c-type biogenesis protein CcmH [Alphaproteobacteria bacterium]